MTGFHNQTSLKYVFREPRQPESGKKPPLLLVLHGFGSNEQDLIGFAPHFDGRFFTISPRAPFALNFGGYAWFEINFGSPAITIKDDQAETSRRTLLKFIDEIVEKHDLDDQRIFIAGFSQGAIMNFTLALSEPEKFAGVVAMSGVLIENSFPVVGDVERLRDLPMIVTHGIYDPVLPVGFGRAARDYLTKLPVNLTYHEYPDAHHASEESLRDVAAWLEQRLTGELATDERG